MATNDTEISKLEEQVEELATELEKAVEAANQPLEDQGVEVLKAALKKAKAKAKGEEPDDSEPDDDEDDTQKLIEKLLEENEQLKVLAKMTQDEKDHCAGKSADDVATFMGKPEADRKKEMNKRLEDDEVLKIEGQEIRKSAVGEAHFAILKAQDARLKKADEDIAKERDAREQAELCKRADDEFKHVPGSVEERAAMLKAMGRLDPAVRKSFEAVFTQSEKLAKGAFETIGKGSGIDDLNRKSRKPGVPGIDAFEKRVEDIHKSIKGISRAEAMTKARTDYPDEFEAYQNRNAN